MSAVERVHVTWFTELDILDGVYVELILLATALFCMLVASLPLDVYPGSVYFSSGQAAIAQWLKW